MINIHGILRLLRRLNTIRQKAPLIEISQSNWLTPNPKVSVSMISRGGAIGLYTYADDDAGNAHASLNASTLANITGLRIVDRRPIAKNEAKRSLLARSKTAYLPRDLATV